MILSLFLALQLLSPDALEFANYVRCDQLVAFFSACIAITFLTDYPDYKKALLIAVFIAAHYGHIMPKLYDTNNLAEARYVSGAFIFERDKIDFLNRAFAEFIRRQAQTLKKDFDKTLVKKVVAFNPELTPEKYDEGVGSYFVVSPNIYNRFLKNDGKGFTKEELDFLRLMQGYYKKMLDNELVTSISSGTDAPIEVYLVR